MCPTPEVGWLYLAGHKDLFPGEIVRYAMSARMKKSLVNDSLFRAVAAKRPAKGLIRHSDLGSQYCAYEYGKLLKQFGMQVSMSGKGRNPKELPSRKSVPMQGTETEQPVVVRKRLKDRGAKGLRYSVGCMHQPARGGMYEFGKVF